jgi:hypothetical protein
VISEVAIAVVERSSSAMTDRHRTHFDRLPLPYVEAYPRFDIRAAHKFWKKGRTRVTWTDGEGRLVGEGICEMISPLDLQLISQFHNIPYLDDGKNQARFRLKLGPGLSEATGFRLNCSKALL